MEAEALPYAQKQSRAAKSRPLHRSVFDTFDFRLMAEGVAGTALVYGPATDGICCETAAVPDNRKMHDGGSRTLALAITGASGSVFSREMLRALQADARVGRVFLVVSQHALRVLAEELGQCGRNELVENLLSEPSRKIVQLGHDDIGAPIASGSFPCDGMIVLPCSMGTLAGIAHGSAANLIERAADVCLKERRPLVLCTRETPLNLIHIRNMAAATEAGATIFPVTPSFYNHPQTVEDIAGNYVARVLQHIGLPQPGAFQWKGGAVKQ